MRQTKDLKTFPSSWKDYCNENDIREGEAYIDSASEIEEYSTDEKRLFNSDMNVLPSKKAAEQHIVLMQLHQLRDFYRQGWEPDWKSPHKEKYCIFHSYNGYEVVMSNKNPFFLSFQSYDIAKLFMFNFEDLIEQAGDFI